MHFCTSHYNEHTAVVKNVFLLFCLCSETERSIVMILYVINLDRTVLFNRVSKQFSAAFEVVQDIALSGVEHVAFL